jgi:hypothetical protein
VWQVDQPDQSVAGGAIDNAEQRRAVAEAADILSQEVRIVSPEAIAAGRTVWRDQYVRQAPQRVLRWQRLDLKGVQAGAGDAALLQRGHECLLVHDPSVSDVDQVRRRLHRGQRGSVDQMVCLAGQRQRDTDEVGFAQRELDVRRIQGYLGGLLLQLVRGLIADYQDDEPGRRA